MLLEHARKIRSGELAWVNALPEADGECCVGYVREAGLLRFVGEPGDRAVSFLTPEIQEIQQALDAEAQERGGVPFVMWNDEQCASREEAADLIEAAAARLPEAE